jgi:hypothetical protein
MGAFLEKKAFGDHISHYVSPSFCFQVDFPLPWAFFAFELVSDVAHSGARRDDSSRSGCSCRGEARPHGLYASAGQA